MAFDVEQIRSTAQRVAASLGLDVVEIEFHGGAKHRILRVFIEKNAEERKRLAQEVAATADVGADPDADVSPRASAGLDQLAGVTHTDCEAFSRDFGTVLDVEDLIPGSEYTLEVSSPGSIESCSPSTTTGAFVDCWRRCRPSSRWRATGTGREDSEK